MLVLLMTAVTGAWADEVTIGENTTTSNITPTRSLYGYSFVGQIYTASEIGTSGTITSIAFHQQSTAGGNPSAVAIYMKHVNKETFESTDDYETVSASDKVWEGTLTYLDGGGWITFTLDTPFEYNGTDNLLIACHETTPGFSERFFYYTKKVNSIISFHSDSAIPDPSNLGSFTGKKSVSDLRSNIKITIAPAPVAVTGVTLPATATVTLGDPVALTAAVAPADATDKKVKWTVATGDDKVKLYTDADCKTEVGTDATDALTVYVKGLAVGEATVKVESNEDATKTATCAVTAMHGTYAVAMKAGVTDGDQWTARAGGSGDFAAMPLKGVEGGTKPVELKYAGDLDVKLP